MPFSQLFGAVQSLIKSKVALPFVKYLLNQLFSPYLFPIEAISEKDSVITIQSLQVRVDEINEMLSAKSLSPFASLFSLKQASLSHISLSPIHSLINYSSSDDPCHITFHNIRAHLAACPHLLRPHELPSHDQTTNNEKVHEIASDIINDLLQEWMLEKEKARRVISEIKKENEPFPHTTNATTNNSSPPPGSPPNHNDNDPRKSSQIIDSVFDKLQIHLKDLQVEIEFPPPYGTYILKIPNVDYKDVSTINKDESRDEVYRFSIPEITVCERSNSSVQTLLRAKDLTIQITLPAASQTIKIKVHQDKIISILAPSQVKRLGSLLSAISCLSQKEEEDAEQSIDSTHKSEYLENSFPPAFESPLSSASSLENSLLFQSFYDEESGKITISTRLLLNSFKLFYLYSDNGVPSRSFEESNSIGCVIDENSNAHNGVQLTAKYIKCEIPTEKELRITIPQFRLQEIHESVQTVLLSSKVVDQNQALFNTKNPNHKPFFEIDFTTRRENHERDIVHQTIDLSDIIARLDLAFIRRLQSSFDHEWPISFSQPSEDTPNFFTHITDSHLKCNLSSLFLHIQDSEQKSDFGKDFLQLSLESFHMEQQSFNANKFIHPESSFSPESIITSLTTVKFEEAVVQMVNSSSKEHLRMADLRDFILILKTHNKMASLKYELEGKDVDENNPSPTECVSSDRVSQMIYDAQFRKIHNESHQISPLSGNLSIGVVDVNSGKLHFQQIQQMMGTISSTICGEVQEIPTKICDLESIAFNKLPELSMTVVLNQVKATLNELQVGPNAQRNYKISGNDILVLLDSFQPKEPENNPPKNSKMKLFVQCVESISIDEVIPHEIGDDRPQILKPLFRTYQKLVKDFRQFKHPIVSNLELRKNDKQFHLNGLLCANGMHLHLNGKDNMQDHLMNGILDFVENPDAPPLENVNVNLEASVNNSMIDFVWDTAAPSSSANQPCRRIIFSAESILLDAKVLIPSREKKVSLSVSLPEEMQAFIHPNLKNLRNDSSVDYPYTSLIDSSNSNFSLESQLRLMGFAPFLRCDQVLAKIFLLGETANPTRKNSSIQAHIQDGDVSLSGAKDTYQILFETWNQFKQHQDSFAIETELPKVGSATEEMQRDTSNVVISSFRHHSAIAEDFLDKRSRQHPQVLIHKPLEHIDSTFFTVTKRYKSKKSNSRSPIPKYLPISEVEVSLMLNFSFDLFEGYDWEMNLDRLSVEESFSTMYKRIDRGQKGNVSVKARELFSQVNIFSNSKLKLVCRSSLKDFSIVYSDTDCVIDVVKPKRCVKRFCDLEVRVSKDDSGTPHITLDVSRLSSVMLSFPFRVYQFFISLIQEKQDIIATEPGDETRQFDESQPNDWEEKKGVDAIFDMFSVTSLNCRASVPFMTARDARISFFGVTFNDVQGSQVLFERLSRHISAKLYQHSLFNIFTSLFFLRNVKGVTDGTYDLIAMPYTHIVRDGRVLFGIQKGISSFLSSFVSETVGCTSDVTYVLGEGMQYVKDIMHKDTDQPSENYDSARLMLLRSIKGAYQPIIAIPSKYRQKGSTAVAKSLIKAVPVMILSPSAGVVRSLSSVLHQAFQSLRDVSDDEQ